MATGGNPQDAPPPPPPMPHAPSQTHLYPGYLPHFPHNPYSAPQFFSTGVNTAPFYPAPPGVVSAPPANPYSAAYGYQIPVPPTYQDPNLVYGGIGAVTNLSISQTAADVSVAGIEKRVNGSKKAPKKLKAVQSWSCDVCKVDCNRKAVLDQHKIGKKHRKNLEKLVAANQKAILPAASADSGSHLIGPPENPAKGKAKEDLGSKTAKLLKEGTAADSVRVCAVCNVVCNSETVFLGHLAGQKHAKALKKHNSG